LDELVRDAKIPGIQYLVVAPEQTVFEYAAGWADIAGRRRLNAATTMMAYSMSKTITAAAVLQLVEAQKVKLDDPIDVYLESQPYGPDVTVRQLMSHTSGIPNPIPLRWVHPAARHDAFDERAELASVLLEHPKLSFPPGTKYRYSNIGYWLLGCIVERASGEPFPSYVREHILQPLGITPQELGYVAPDYRNDHYVNGAAFGGLVGNAGGFGKFLQDQLRPHSALFVDATRQLFYTPQRTKKGKSIQPMQPQGRDSGARCRAPVRGSSSR
jgi:CubicO group peptidase (beta-lactamase class C family)